MSNRTVLMDVNAQMYESGGFIFGKWKDCRILLYSDSRMDWFFDQKKLVGSITLKDLSEHIAFDGLSTRSTQNRPFVPKLIRANLLFSVATDQAAKYFHWFLFENKHEYNDFCDTVASLIGKQRTVKRVRSPSVDPSKRKPRSRSALPNKLRLRRNNDLDKQSSQTPTPMRRHILENATSASVQDLLE